MLGSSRLLVLIKHFSPCSELLSVLHIMEQTGLGRGRVFSGSLGTTVL